MKAERRSGLWTCDQTAAFLQVSPVTLQRWRSKGTGPAFIRFGREVRYAPGHVMAWLDDHQVKR